MHILEKQVSDPAGNFEMGENVCIVIIGDHLPLDPSLSKVLVLLLVLLAYWRSKNASGASDFRWVRIVLVH